MAEVSAIQAAMQDLDVARFTRDVKRIAAAKSVLAQLIAAQQIPLEPHPDTEATWQLAAD